MDKMKKSRKRQLKVEIESEHESSRSKGKSSSNNLSNDVEVSRACTSDYFKNETFRLSFGDAHFDEISNKDEIKPDFSIGDQLAEPKSQKKIKFEPDNWKLIFEYIRQMRGQRDAPVDTMGCDAIASLDVKLSPKDKRYQVLVSLMLSAQTKDEVTAKAMRELQKLPLNIDNFLACPDDKLEKMIYPVSFYKRKVVYIKRTSQILKEKYDGDIPSNVDELQNLPGVGPKMAYLTMTCAWNETVGIGVDTHVHRISNRLGWTKQNTKTPEQTRKELEEWLPQSHWEEVNHLLVGFGQTICKPVGPRCQECLCKNVCPTGINSSIEKKKNTKKKKIN